MLKFIIDGFILIAIIILHYTNFSNEITLLLLGYLLPELIRYIAEYFKYIKIMFQSINKDKVRISIAYLIRIKLKGSQEDEYMLIRSGKIKDQFQPVGGVFQYYDNSILKRFSMSEDEGFSTSPKNDLRKMIQKPFLNLPRFLVWFNGQKERELSPHREFYEELILENILDPIIFRTPSFRHITQVVDGITYSKHFKTNELKVFEIFEIILTPEQEQALLNLKNSQHSDCVFVSYDQITSLGFDKKTNTTIRIGEHTKFIT